MPLLLTSGDVSSGFQKRLSQMHKIDNIGDIANFVFPYISHFLLYLYRMMFVNVKLDISECKSSTFQGCKLYLSNSFPMAQPKQNCQY